ncbi:hypothetical protein BH11PSE5_BH11PSE5_04680 [soil metagenome]
MFNSYRMTSGHAEFARAFRELCGKIGDNGGLKAAYRGGCRASQNLSRRAISPSNSMEFDGGLRRPERLAGSVDSRRRHGGSNSRTRL